MTDDDEDVLAIQGSSSKASTMADGSLRLQIDIMPNDAQQAFKMFGTPGSAIALARLTDEIAVDNERPGKPEKGLYGEWARSLVASGFFRAPKIWEGIGTDKEFLEWVKMQKSAVSGEFSEFHDTGECFCVAAHVRHVELGSGTAEKPPYAAIPLTKAEHDLCHQKGDIAIGDREWWDKKRIKYVSQWAYETLKAKMGYGSYTDMAPSRLIEWAKQRNLDYLLPSNYFTLGEVPIGEATESAAARTG